MNFIFWFQVASIIVKLVKEAEEIYEEAKKGESKKDFVLAILSGILERISNPHGISESDKEMVLAWAENQINVTVDVFNHTGIFHRARDNA